MPADQDPRSNDPSATSRRVLLATIAAIPLVPALAACGGGTVDAPDLTSDAGDDAAGDASDDGATSDAAVTCGGTNVGLASALPVGSYKRAGTSTRPFIVGQDATGYYAFSAICTHQGCTVSLRTAGASYCGCHGATFDSNGNVTRGPATRPLSHYLVTICDGNLYVDPTKTVAQDVRVQA